MRYGLVLCKSVYFSLGAVDAGEDLVGVLGPGEKGLGWSLQWSMNALMAATNSLTEAEEPRRIAWRRRQEEAPRGLLLLGEDVDNWVLSDLREFEGKRLRSVTQGTADLDQEEGPRTPGRLSGVSPLTVRARFCVAGGWLGGGR